LADNIQLSAAVGTGAVLASDEVVGGSTVHYPKGKVVFGADGTATDVTSAAGLPVHQQTSAVWAFNLGQVGGTNVGATNPLFVRLSDGSAAIATLPVSLASVPSHAVTNAGTFAVQVDNTVTVTGAGGTFPVTDSGGSLTIDNAALSVTGGGAEASALRVTIASDSTGVLSVDDNGSTLSIDDGGSSITVDGTVAVTIAQDVMLGTDFSDVFGTASLLTTTQADNLGNTTDSINTSSLAYVFDGTAWDRARGDSTDGLLVNLGSNNDVTVTGSVTANAGTNLNTSALALESGGNLAGAATSLATIDDWDESDRAKVNLIVGQAGVAAGAGAVGATVQRVTLASDDPAVVSLAALDNAVSENELQVDVVAALPAGDNAVGRVKLTDGTDVADILDLTNSNPLTVAIVDTNGDQIASFGGGTQYTEDAAAAANPVGTAPILVRKDTPASEVSADGDNIAQRGSTYGAAYVTLIDNGGNFLSVGGGTQYTEDAAAAANPVGNALNLVRDDARGGSLTSADGDNVAARGTNAGELYVKHFDSIAITHAALTELAAAIDTEIQCDIVGALPAGTNNIGDVDVLSVVPGTGATNLGKAIDTATGATDTGVLALATRDDVLASLTPADGDNVQLRTNSVGALWVAANGTVEVDASGFTVTVQGAVDLSGNALTALQLIDNPVVVDDAAFTPATTSVNVAGFFADETATDSVDEGDAGAARMTLDRKQIVTPQPHTAGGLAIFRSIDLDETEEEVKATAGCVYGMWVTNLATSTRFVKFYNATAANVTVGTTTPVITIPIPGNASDDVTGFFGSTHGIEFGTAITVAATTAVADNDTGAPGANEVVINLFYK
jgi:hypothetical protein